MAQNQNITKNPLENFGKLARQAALTLSCAPSKQKNKALVYIADELLAKQDFLRQENQKDLIEAEKNQLSPALIDRLTLDTKRILAMADGARHIASLDDPCGEILEKKILPNKLKLAKIRVPIGVIGIIFESRPNVTCDAATLCLKSGNAAILRGGKEAFHSNQAIAECIQKGLTKAKLPPTAIQVVKSTDRAGVRHMAELEQYIDLIIPRGGHGLIKAVVDCARIPVIKHYHGVCNLYVESDADIAMAVALTDNSKTQRPGVCNALENLLINEKIADAFIPELAKVLASKSVEIRADESSLAIFQRSAYPQNLLKQASENDWSEEYLALILAVKIVQSRQEAIDFINTYGSAHSDVIVTKDMTAAADFISKVDSAAIFHNASSRFHDGGEFGFGAEIGISTDKIHARGPMALPELTIYKYVIHGEGQTRS